MADDPNTAVGCAQEVICRKCTVAALVLMQGAHGTPSPLEITITQSATGASLVDIREKFTFYIFIGKQT